MRNKVISSAVLALALLASGCTHETQFGECVGLWEDKEPGLKYELSVRNVVLATVFVQTVFVPIIVVAKEALCPVGRKGE